MSTRPGAMLGLLGGGQLGRMFTMAAQSLGYSVTVLDPEERSPAGSIAERHLRADYLDSEALNELASTCAGVTTEFENVPAEALRILAERCIVSPAARSVAIAQNRILEKNFLAANGFEVVPYAVIQDSDTLQCSANPDEILLQKQPEFFPGLFPGILKVSRFGYDGKGQVRVSNASELDSAFAGLNRESCVLEKLLPLEREVSVIVSRGFDDEVVTFPVSENQHCNGILDISIVPARVSPEIARNACDIAVRIAGKLDYRGVLCVEFFVLADGRLLVNEIAPRPHNSGHYSINACVTSQFEQQVRILCGMPLGSTSMHGAAVMVNLLGDLWQKGEPEWEQVLRHPDVKLHLYGKRDARPGRKMGHYTVLAETTDAALRFALEIKQSLQLSHSTLETHEHPSNESRN
ncbi:5-(carboxyamino)imidazole ribonucleotide synthase [Nitrosospira multiformis]|uniref:N5-carboxyaminoimidazole ribonucleotide synthase n=1 Tax=Nitrosospira multiformis TaxID=1231 RepID=A0A1I7F7X7_9PROT|nr:5-(carboxyamino)imidazole ribonucleotide synthase [Nitrosospira multiformis]SFU32264.1 5-(carboxyamino)imidazole ribonucleotide synthase [Nitrosospira multiformis]